MDKRKETLRTKRICRFCLKDEEPLTSIYDRSIRGKNPVPLPLQIMACVSIEVFPSDGMPGTICQVCRYFMDQSYRFKQICKQGDEALRHYLTHGDLRAPIAWAKDMIERVPKNVLTESVVQTSIAKDFSEDEEEEEEDDDDDDDEDEDVESPKPIKKEFVEINPIRRGRLRKPSKVEETKKPTHTTTVVVTAEEDGTVYSVTQGDEEDGEGEGAAPEEAQPAEVPTNVFPCTQCERSFPLQQLLEIHQKIHKRERTHPCSLCESSFFSKYDLQKHKMVHSGLKPFECVVCQRSFSRLTLLRRHEKIHTTVPKLLCSECDMMFLSAKELDIHRRKRHSWEKPFVCKQCPKRFTYKQGLLRHAVAHNSQKPLKCQYCPESFTSSHRLTKHVQSHAGNRPYLCKFCPKAFLLSHHYTRHLRTKHMPESTASKKNSLQSSPEHYKCAQCNVIFQKQDELIFHSAVHATQDLTCPLCKESFQDVDDVVVHIKSHIEGEQFMCEWCELVFMCEEKLDSHIDAEHREQASEDPFKEISYLEGCLVDESELLYMNQSYEADEEEEGENEEFFENQNESEQAVEEEQEEEEEEEQEDEEEEQEQDDDSEFVNDKEVKFSNEIGNPPPLIEMPLIEANNPQPVSSPVATQLAEDDSSPTYIELKTVQPPELQQPAKVSTPVSSKASILQKAEEVKMQRRLAEQLKEKHRALIKAAAPTPAAGQAEKPQATPEKREEKRVEKVDKIDKSPEKPKSKIYTSDKEKPAKKDKVVLVEKFASKKAVVSSLATPKNDSPKKALIVSDKEKKDTPSPRSGEKSLQLLEKDIMELKKNAASSSSNDKTPSNQQRFLSRKQKRESPEDGGWRGNVFKKPAFSPKKTHKEIEKVKGEEKPLYKSRAISSSVTILPPKPHVVSPSPSSSSSMKSRVVSEESEDGAASPPRRSRRPSKIKDYAAMIRDRTGLDSDDEDEQDSEDEDSYNAENEEFDIEMHSTPQVEKKPAQPSSTPSTGKKRGRPRKYPLDIESPLVTPTTATPPPKRPAETKPSTPEISGEPVVKRGRGRPKLIKNLPDEEKLSTPVKTSTPISKSTIQKYFRPATPKEATKEDKKDSGKESTKGESKEEPKPAPKGPIKIQKAEGVVQTITNAGQTVLMSPSGQTLKKIPAQMVKSLPPGVKPLQLPRGAVTEMKMGARTVRVQKILMTKADVEAMTKQGLVQIKDGAMVLKPGVKLPSALANRAASPAVKAKPEEKSAPKEADPEKTAAPSPPHEASEQGTETS